MSIRFWWGVRIVPGLRVNLSKSGASLSVGRRGAWYTSGPRGRRATVGLPGTGLFWTERAPPAAPHHAGHRWALAFVVGAVAVAVLILSVLGLGVTLMTKKAAVEKAEKDRAQRSTMKYPSPPPRKKSIVANPCEVLALKVIVGHLFIDLAHLNEKLNGTPLQAFGNAFSVRCQEVLLSAKIVAPDGLDVEALRRDAINHVNKILAVKFAGGRAKTN